MDSKDKLIGKFFEAVEKSGIHPDKVQKERILEKLNNIIGYAPKVGIFGKTGVGKSSLTNALFGQDVCKINDIEACTRETQEVLLDLGTSKGLTLIDVPGVGESRERDKEYSFLYENLLPELDVVIWILKGDDRAFSSDEEFYKNIVKPHLDQGKPFLIVLNQVDKIEPFREWDIKKNLPGKEQSENIEKKKKNVSQFFDIPLSKVVPVSANEKYNLMLLVDEIVFSLPVDKQATFLRKVEKDWVSEETRQAVTENTGKYILGGAATGATIGAAIAGPVGAAIGGAIGGAVGWVKSKCYISTATCLAIGKGDDCYELSIFRSFRDSWLLKQKDGKDIVSSYYSIAPDIVDKIYSVENSKREFFKIWHNYLSKCLRHIENKRYQKAKKLYIAMVETLNKRFLT